MIRVTDEDVKGIMEVDPLLKNLKPFRKAANLIIEAKFAETELSEEHLTEIECWLAAHFVAIRDMRAASENAGSAAGRVGIDYQYKVDLDLRSTMYGQAAITLDTSGVLKSMTDEKSGGAGIFKSINPDLWG